MKRLDQVESAIFCRSFLASKGSSYSKIHVDGRIASIIKDLFAIYKDPLIYEDIRSNMLRI